MILSKYLSLGLPSQCTIDTYLPINKLMFISAVDKHGVFVIWQMSCILNVRLDKLWQTLGDFKKCCVWGRNFSSHWFSFREHLSKLPNY